MRISGRAETAEFIFSTTVWTLVFVALGVNHQCFSNARQTQHWEPLTQEMSLGCWVQHPNHAALLSDPSGSKMSSTWASLVLRDVLMCREFKCQCRTCWHLAAQLPHRELHHPAPCLNSGAELCILQSDCSPWGDNHVHPAQSIPALQSCAQETGGQ